LIESDQPVEIGDAAHLLKGGARLDHVLELVSEKSLLLKNACERRGD
jgi:hypothetical protein